MILHYDENWNVCLQEFQAARKEGVGVMSRLADSFHNMSAAYMMKNRDTEFDDITAYVNAFADKLAVTDRISQRLLKEQYGEFTTLRPVMHNI